MAASALSMRNDCERGCAKLLTNYELRSLCFESLARDLISKHKVQSIEFYPNDAAIAWSKISNATSTFSLVRISGGDQRIVFVPAPRMISPRSKQATSTRSRNSGAA